MMKAMVQPANTTIAAANPAAEPAEVLSTSKQARILLAEDMDVNQFVAKEILARNGYSCDIVSTGREAVEAVSKKQYDGVLMDLQMPEMSGLEAAAAIRTMERSSGGVTRHLPIIALTANAIKGDRERCLAAGMDSYLTKPLNPKLLIAAIQTFVGNEPAADPDQIAVERRSEAATAQTYAPEQCANQIPSSSAIDFESLLARCMGDRALVAKIAQKFHDRSVVTMQQLRTGFEAGDPAETARLAHSMKGAAANLSAIKLSELAAQIESLGNAGDLSTAEDALKQLAEELEKCRAELQLIASPQGDASVPKAAVGSM